MSVAAWKELFLRANNGDKDEVRDVLKANGGGIEAITSLSNPKTGDNVLHSLCRDEGHLAMLEFVVDICGEGACGLGNFDGKTPLHEAAQCKNAAAVAYLLERSAIQLKHFWLE